MVSPMPPDAVCLIPLAGREPGVNGAAVLVKHLRIHPWPQCHDPAGPILLRDEFDSALKHRIEPTDDQLGRWTLARRLSFPESLVHPGCQNYAVDEWMATANPLDRTVHRFLVRSGPIGGRNHDAVNTSASFDNNNSDLLRFLLRGSASDSLPQRTRSRLTARPMPLAPHNTTLV
jgi:hypothetical protein